MLGAAGGGACAFASPPNDNAASTDSRTMLFDISVLRFHSGSHEKTSLDRCSGVNDGPRAPRSWREVVERFRRRAVDVPSGRIAPDP